MYFNLSYRLRDFHINCCYRTVFVLVDILPSIFLIFILVIFLIFFLIFYLIFSQKFSTSFFVQFRFIYYVQRVLFWFSKLSSLIILFATNSFTKSGLLSG